jgi:2-desacetyl-2-hydroxyethyl bacteriochlorophyllide A dehydrogenase
MEFKAAVLTGINAPLEILELETTELKVGQVLVKIEVSGICGAQLQEISGQKGNEKFLPHLMGHEGSGRIVEVGQGVKSLKPGDKVVMHWRVGEGIESDFPQYLLGDRQISSGKVNTLSEYSVVSENRLTKIGHEVPSEFAALLGCAISTSYSVIDNDADIKFGSTVLVVGCGGVGLNLIRAARDKGAGLVDATDKSATKSVDSIEFGASTFIKIENLDQIPSGKYDRILDTTGNPGLINKLVSKLSRKGKLILVGQIQKNVEFNFSNASSLFEGDGKEIKTTQAGNFKPEVDIARLINFHQSGGIDFQKLISHKYPLSQINQAFEMLTTGNARRILIYPGIN